MDGPLEGKYKTLSTPFFEVRSPPSLNFDEKFMPFMYQEPKTTKYKVHKLGAQRDIASVLFYVNSIKSLVFKGTGYVATCNPWGTPEDPPEESLKGIKWELVPQADFLKDFDLWFLETRIKNNWLKDFEVEILNNILGELR